MTKRKKKKSHHSKVLVDGTVVGRSRDGIQRKPALAKRLEEGYLQAPESLLSHGRSKLNMVQVMGPFRIKEQSKNGTMASKLKKVRHFGYEA